MTALGTVRRGSRASSARGAAADYLEGAKRHAETSTELDAPVTKQCRQGRRHQHERDPHGLEAPAELRVQDGADEVADQQVHDRPDETRDHGVPPADEVADNGVEALCRVGVDTPSGRQVFGELTPYRNARSCMMSG